MGHMLLDRVRREDDRLLVLPSTRIPAYKIQGVANDEVGSDLVDQLSNTLNLPDSIFGSPGEQDLRSRTESLPRAEKACEDQRSKGESAWDRGTFVMSLAGFIPGFLFSKDRPLILLNILSMLLPPIS